MDQTSQSKANKGATNGGETDETPASYALTTYDDDQQRVPLASVPPSPAPAAGGVAFVPLSASAYPAAIPPPALPNPHEIAFQQLQPQQQLQAFWAGQLAEAEQQEAAAGEVKKAHHHSLPLARIKKIMKADRDVKMIAAEAPAVFARACEMFILELTLRAWLHTEGGARRRTTLQRGDVVAAIHSTETYDFLTDVVPEEERSSWSRGDGGPPMPPTTTAMPGVVPPLPSYSYCPAPVATVPFATYANMQPPVTYMWAPPEHHHQQNSDGGRDQQE